MHSTPQPPTAAGEHFGRRRTDPRRAAARQAASRDRHVQIALVHATLAVAAGVLGETVADRENDEATTQASRSAQASGWRGALLFGLDG
jgi:hypothetical protein